MLVDNQIKEYLRLQDEPLIEFNEVVVHEILTLNVNSFINYLDNFYKLWAANSIVVESPQKQIFNNHDINGDYRLMNCNIYGFRENPIKVVKVIGTNEENCVIKDKISVGKALKLHPSDNFVTAIFDVCVLSSFRTAAISALAFKYCQNCANKVGIIGAGRIGFYTSLILASYFNITELFISDVDKMQIKRFKSLAKSYFPSVSLIETNNERILNDCDVIFLATHSCFPITNGNYNKTINFLSSVGADADNISELTYNFIQEMRIVVDTLSSIYIGDLKRWHSNNLDLTSGIIELKDMIKNYLNPSRTVFISTGYAVQDALTCEFIIENYKK